ncbi:glycoside hydrolase family 2 TIM barrel-domain containing protein [Mucilaginibacter sp. PAMB04274]|uniref:glycoside hydrolase family 2 TIM barrel-domain containing protein n=1 Tax=Mucilaginibacter sp. PAMB04274 TaxID=3138568 RepID=UPI0031F6C00A
MRRIALFSLLIFTCANISLAQDKAKKRLTPFTGTDYMRLVVDADYQTAGSNNFKVIIKAAAGGSILWQGAVRPQTVDNAGKKQLAFNITGLKPVLWTPNNPFLYNVTLEQYSAGKLRDQLNERAGFRSFERRGGNLFLNGKPIFLRGIAINPPGRGIPDKLEKSRAFALDYVRFMKSINVNIIRIPDAEEWFDVCDELGMMVFGGNYSGKVGTGEKVEDFEAVGDETDGGFPKDYDKGVAWYEHKKLGAIAHHPSLMVYAMTNETPFVGKRAEMWEKFLTYAFGKLKGWDETRVYIANAGYGYGKTGDICDLHRYWGWYYSSPYTFLNIRNNEAIIPFPKKGQPITFTECVGNYTGPDGRYNLTPWHKNPSSQLAWTGHEQQALQSQLADEHQKFTIRQATESFRQFRNINPDLSGVFPFTILFYNWDSIEKFADMKPKPATEQVKISYQPVLLSWECYTPNVYAASTVKAIAHIINDDNDFSDIKNATLIYELKDKTHAVVLKDSVKLKDLPYYAEQSLSLNIKLPEKLTTGDYELAGKVMSGAETISKNTYKLFVADKLFTAVTTTPVLLYDKAGATKKAFDNLQIKYTEVSSFNKVIEGQNALVIGENSADKSLSDNAVGIKKFISNGGRVISLRQDSVHMAMLNALLANPVGNTNTNIDNPVYPVSNKSPRNGYYVNPERPDHPIFAGITRANLRVWSDYSDWDATQKGFPANRPVTDGFTFENSDDILNTAILANFGSGLRGVTLAEQYSGRGSVMLCGLDLAKHVSVDPVASRLLLNMVSYAGSPVGHEVYQLITSPIIWGEYQTEKGVVTDIYSGFLVNSTPRLPESFTKGVSVTPEGYQLAGGSRSGFNSRPGIQYVANGRRPFGPYVHSFGGQPQISDKNSVVGIGKFWCRIPTGQNNVTSVVWNPGKEPLEIKVKVNALAEVSRTIKAGEKLALDCPVDKNEVNITYTGDRRLVVLETAFSKK